MKLFMSGVCLSLALAFAVSAQEGEFQTWMKTVNKEMGDLRKNEKKTGPEAAMDAEKLADVYTHMVAFWNGRNAPDAAKIAEDGKAAAEALVVAAKADDSEKATAAFKTLGGTCKGCHEAHREKTDAGYKIK